MRSSKMALVPIVVALAVVPGLLTCVGAQTFQNQINFTICTWVQPRGEPVPPSSIEFPLR